MKEFEKFLNLFLKRLIRPAVLTGRKIYQKFPPSLKKKLTTDNLELAIIILLILILFGSYFWPASEADQNKLAVSRWPLSIKNHLQLAQSYFDNDELNKTEIEVEKAKRLYKFFKIFDFKKRAAEKIKAGESLVSQPEKIKKQINYWQTILKDKPNFRDVYLHLSLLHYQLWQDEKAKQAWEKAFYLDPNNENVQAIGELVNQ